MALCTDQLNSLDMIESKELERPHVFKELYSDMDKRDQPQYGYYLTYGLKGAADAVYFPKTKYFKYIREAKAFVSNSLTVEHTLISLVRGKCVPFHIETRLAV